MKELNEPMPLHIDIPTVVGQLTLEEKASLVLGSDFWRTAPVPRLGIPALLLSDGPHGLRVQPGQGDHVGAFGSLPATCFPTASALASAFDPGLLEEVGAALAQEASALGVGVVLGPGVNIKRSPLCGRNFEYLSEDPYVAGVLGAAMVGALQANGVGASLKHYAVNNQETDRLRVSADVDERTLREIYLPAFEQIVREAAPATVMCAYNRINGKYASEHHWLLQTVLREEWDFEGLVVSDWGAVHDRVASLAAGLDLEMPPYLGVSDLAIIDAVREGRLSEDLLDQSVTRVLELVARFSADGSHTESTIDEDAHHALARRVASECAVLLKNDGHVLPLQPHRGSVIAVVGELAIDPRFQGAGSSRVSPTRVDSPLAELRAIVPDGVDVRFAQGYSTAEEQEDVRLAVEAEQVARESDVVVLFLGLPDRAESEGFDRENIELPANQLDLLHRLADPERPLVVVLSNGSVVRTADWEVDADAILECWLGGQAVGGAAADLLLGRASPSGRLAETIPVRLEDTPSFLGFPGEEGHVRYGEGVFVGYRGYDRLARDVAFPFGHGLSYTDFSYSGIDIQVRGSVEAGDLDIEVSCTVTNIGDRAGKEVVQLYVTDVESAVARPLRELKGFAKVALDVGASQVVRFRLGVRDLAFWSVRSHEWVVEAGEFVLALGASSRDIRLSNSIVVPAPDRSVALTPMSTLEEWLADPIGGPRLRSAVGTDESGRPRGILGDPDRLKRIGNFPLITLGAFPGVGLEPALISALTEDQPDRA